MVGDWRAALRPRVLVFVVAVERRPPGGIPGGRLFFVVLDRRGQDANDGCVAGEDVGG